MSTTKDTPSESRTRPAGGATGGGRLPPLPQGARAPPLADRGGGAGWGSRGPRVCGAVGIISRHRDCWARTDLVRPSLADARGSGPQRRFSDRARVRLKGTKTLLAASVRLLAARRSIGY